MICWRLRRDSPASSPLRRATSQSSHWFHLGRALTPVDWGSALVSWSGSMFEYLMPALVMRSPSGSLLDQTSHLIVRRQRKYGAERGVPWGISESAYNARDLELTYQYSNFGVPGLGLKRGLSEDVVVAPYATALAAMIDPAGGGAELRTPHRSRRERSVWLLRGARLHGHAGPRGRHAWPSCAPIWRITKGCRSWRSRTSSTRRYAHALSRRAVHASHRAAAAGTHATGRRWSPGPGSRRCRRPRMSAILFHRSSVVSPPRTI